MLIVYPEDQDKWRQINIDPGVNDMGFNVMDFYRDGSTHLIDVMTLRGGRLAKPFSHIMEIHGEKIAKLHGIEIKLLELFTKYCPDEVVSEAPYMGQFPEAYSSLVQCLTAIRRALMAYDRHLPLIQIDPATVKKAVGVSGKSGDKGLMKEAIEKLWPSIIVNEGIILSALNQHEIDSIAVGIARKLMMQGVLPF